MKELLENLMDILDTEIKSYTELRDLYTKKRELLVKNAVLELADVDPKIVETYENIKKIDIKRVEATKLIGEDINCMTQLVELAKEQCPKLAPKIKDRQNTLENLTRSISVLNLTNMDLIKHGMIITDKKLNILINACSPKANSYSANGKEENKDLSMSTIVQDV